MLAQLSHEHQRTALRLSGDAGGEGVSRGARSAHAAVVVVLCWVGVCVCVCVVGQHCPGGLCKDCPSLPSCGRISNSSEGFPPHHKNRKYVEKNRN